MKVKDLTGREHTWDLSHNRVFNNETKPRSALHIAARALLREEYKTDTILEEVYLPGVGLYLDFYLPKQKRAVEVHGQQHYEYNSFFYPNKAAWLKAQMNDKRKIQWCEVNNIEVIFLSYKENQDEWRKRIR